MQLKHNTSPSGLFFFLSVMFSLLFSSTYPFSAPLLLYSGREPVQEVWWDPAPLSHPPSSLFNPASFSFLLILTQSHLTLSLTHLLHLNPLILFWQSASSQGNLFISEMGWFVCPPAVAVCFHTAVLNWLWQWAWCCHSVRGCPFHWKICKSLLNWSLSLDHPSIASHQHPAPDSPTTLGL